MIQARELMVGNWLLFSNKIEPDRYVQVNAWFLRQLVSDINDNNPTVNGYYQPIPLTPEILEKTGFNNPQGDYWIKGNELMIALDSVWWWTNAWQNDGEFGFEALAVWREIKYLHQLQNLYFALTGQKLPINNLNTTN